MAPPRPRSRSRRPRRPTGLRRARRTARRRGPCVTAPSPPGESGGALRPDAVVAAAYAHLLADAQAVLERWAARDAGPETLRRDYLRHLAAHPDGVARDGPPAHLTASCVVLDEAGEQVLLTLHRRARAWFQFGGP